MVLVGMVFIVAAVALGGGLLWLGHAASTDADAMMMDPPLDRTHRQTLAERREHYATAQTFDAAAFVVGVLLTLAAGAVVLFTGMGATSSIGVLAGVVVTVVGVLRLIEHRASALTVETNEADLQNEGQLDEHPVSTGQV